MIKVLTLNLMGEKYVSEWKGEMPWIVRKYNKNVEILGMLTNVKFQ